MARDVNVGPGAEKKLERYGVWVKVEPRDVPRDLGGSLELTDLESPPPDGTPARASFTDEEEHLLDELETGVGHEVAAGTQVELESLDERLPPLTSDDTLPELELEDAVEVPLADDKPGAGRFDDLESLEGGIPEAPSGAAGNPEILSRIERELRSIRSDLSALKKELADLRRPGAVAARAGGAGSGPKAAFFEEEDDDTIALTGDELDNILNTADITEEAAEEPAASPDIAAEPVEELEEVPDLELEPTESAPTELVLDDAGAAPAEAGELPSLDLDAIPEIEGVGEAELEELPGGDDAIADADLVADLEAAPAAAASMRSPSGAETDLEALTDAQEAGGEPILSTDDLAASDLAELEAVAEEPTPADGAPIEIDFEPSPAPAGAGAVDAEAEALEEVGSLEEIEAVEELEEVADGLEEAPAAAEPVREPEPSRPARQPESSPATGPKLVLDEGLKNDLKNVLAVIDELLYALPEKKIREFAKSDHFKVYEKLFSELGLDKPR